MKQTITLWCEYDIGCNDTIFANMEEAKIIAQSAIRSCGLLDEFDSMDEMIAEGLLSFHENKVIGS